MRLRRGSRGKGTLMYAVILGGAFIIIIVVLAIAFGYFYLRDSSRPQQGPSQQQFEQEKEEVMYTSAIQMDPISDTSTTIATVRNRKGAVLSPAQLIKRQEHRQKMRDQRQQTATTGATTTGATGATTATTGATTTGATTATTATTGATTTGATTATTQSIPNPIAGSGGTCPDAQAVLAYHNAVRNAHGTPPLVWSDTVAAIAQTHANAGNYMHSNGLYGENIAMGPGLTCEGAAKLWYETEIWKMPWGNPGAPMFEAAGHATAMLWKATTEMGCGFFPRADGQNFVVCQYNPPGNMGGFDIVNNYKFNVLPPK